MLHCVNVVIFMAKKLQNILDCQVFVIILDVIRFIMTI